MAIMPRNRSIELHDLQSIINKMGCTDQNSHKITTKQKAQHDIQKQRIKIPKKQAPNWPPPAIVNPHQQHPTPFGLHTNRFHSPNEPHKQHLHNLQHPLTHKYASQLPLDRVLATDHIVGVLGLCNISGDGGHGGDGCQSWFLPLGPLATKLSAMT
jgi:hypothetical protein